MSDAVTQGGGAEHGALRRYLTGFGLAVALTSLAFALVMTRVLPLTVTLGVIFAAAVLQMLVHLHYFLHLDATAEQSSRVLALAFTFVIIVLVAGGTIWILFNLRYRTQNLAAAVDRTSHYASRL